MIEINLLKESDKKRKRISFNFQGVSSIVVMALAVLLVAEIVGLAVYSLKLNHRVYLLTQKRNHLRNVEREVNRIRARLKQVKTMTQAIKKLSKNRGMAARILKDVADVMPDGLWLVKLTKKNNVVNIEGRSFTAEAVAQYMTNLGNLGYVQKVRFNGNGLVRIKSKSAPNVYKFYISVTLKG